MVREATGKQGLEQGGPDDMDVSFAFLLSLHVCDLIRKPFSLVFSRLFRSMFSCVSMLKLS